MIQIEIQQVTKQFGKQLVLDHIDLTVNKGDFYALVGANGVGKTTLMNIINQTLRVSSGEVTIHKRAQVGYLSDEIQLPEYLTGLEFLTFVAKSWQVTLNDFATIIDQLQLKMLLDQQIVTYSKGTRQKIRFLALLLQNPTVLLLDEPLTGVDETSIDVIVNQIKAQQQRGVSIIYATHIKSTLLPFANAKILHLMNGKLLQENENDL